MAKVFSNQEFEEKVYSILGEEYSVLGYYVNNHTKILMKHNKCDHEWEVAPMTLIRTNKPTKCPNCFGTPKINTDIFKEQVKKLVGDEYSVLGEYVKNNTKVLMKHNKCGHEWENRPNDFKTGYRCPNCFGTPKKSTNKFKEEVKKLTGSEYSVLGEYKGTNIKILLKHNKCGHEWEVKPNNFLNLNNRCPICALKIKESRGVQKIKSFLIMNGIKYQVEVEFDNCKNIRNLKFDFFLPEFNLLIEFDGMYHFEQNREIFKHTLPKQRKRDRIKNKWCKDHLISLLRIDSSNEDKIEKILKSFLIKESSTTIESFDLYYINEDSSLIRDNHKYNKLQDE